CGMLFLITAVFPFLHGYLLVARQERDWTIDEFQRWLLIDGSIRTLLHVVAFSLMLTAVFAGRRVVVGVKDTTTSEYAAESGRQPHRATLVLVLGILSLIVCAPLGIAAWVMSSNDLAAMRAGRMDRSGESLTGVGQVLGIIGTVLFGLGVVGVLLWFAVVGAMLLGR
ncbi:MAG: hypothetical protein AB7F89_24100, partial [Pirellulaceae bacterium]